MFYTSSLTESFIYDSGSNKTIIKFFYSQRPHGISYILSYFSFVFTFILFLFNNFVLSDFVSYSLWNLFESLPVNFWSPLTILSPLNVFLYCQVLNSSLPLLLFPHTGLDIFVFHLSIS